MRYFKENLLDFILTISLYFLEANRFVWTRMIVPLLKPWPRYWHKDPDVNHLWPQRRPTMTMMTVDKPWPQTTLTATLTTCNHHFFKQPDIKLCTYIYSFFKLPLSYYYLHVYACVLDISIEIFFLHVYKCIFFYIYVELPRKCVGQFHIYTPLPQTIITYLKMIQF